MSPAPAPHTQDRPPGGPTSAIERAPWLLRHPRSARATRPMYRRAKRGLDLAAVAITAPVWVPVYALCAAAIKFDSPDGPVHFRQMRTGAGGNRIGIYKFRTMVPNAEALKASLAHLNEREPPDFKITNDPRVTRFGRFLRRTSLDELPQMLNVIGGDLTLVGPRPWSRSLDHHDDWHLERYDVPAGVTGLWQIAARDSESFVERIRLDLAYVQRQRLLLDLEILLRSVPAILGRRGAV